MAKDILDAVYGCLIAGAIGDALGAPVEGMYWTEIREKHGKVTELMPGIGNTGKYYGGSDGYRYRDAYDGPTPKIGWFSDDTTMRHYLSLAIARKRGRITPDDYRNVLIEKFNPNRVWTADRVIFGQLKAGMNPWDSGLRGIPSGCATMSIAPIGIINAGNPPQAYQDGFNIAFMSQEGHNRDGAATWAAGVAAAFIPGITLEEVLEIMTQHTSYLMRRAIDLTMDLAYASNTVDEFAEKYYATMLDWTWPWPPDEVWNKENYFSGNTIELVPITMAILHLTKGDIHESMIEAASFGRDCDTTASMAGQIAGAMVGADAIRQDWIDTVEEANEDFFEEVDGDPKANFYAMAKRLVEALHSERQALKRRAETLDTILE